MKKITLPIVLLSTLFINQATAQSNKAFAITAETKGTYNWTAIKEIDLATGDVVRSLFSPSNPKKIDYLFSSTDNKVDVNMRQLNSPTQNGVAATAYDSKHNRLYFSQMWGNDLRYLDLNGDAATVVIIQLAYVTMKAM